MLLVAAGHAAAPPGPIPVLVGDYPPSTWLEREGWTVATLVDDASSSGLAALGMSSFPGFVFVDGDGRVVQRYTGEMPAEAFDQVVRALAP